jgi:hypothetical protein
MKKRFIALIGILALTSLAGTALAGSATASEILVQSKAASGGSAWDAITSLRTVGTIQVAGLTGMERTVQDLRTGRSVTHTKVGPVTQAEGFDGTTGWQLTPEGDVFPADAPASKRQSVTDAYQTARGWWYPRHWPAQIKLLGKRRDGAKRYWVLRIVPRGGSPFEMWIDAKTWRIARRTDGAGFAPSTTWFSDYRTVKGVKIAFHTRQVTNGVMRNATIKQVQMVEMNNPIDAKTFRMPHAQPGKATFAKGRNEASFPFRLLGQPYIKVNINGHAFWLALDSNGVNFLTAAAAKAAGIKSQGHFAGQGAGENTFKAGFATIKTLTLGGKVTLHDQVFKVASLPSLAGSIFAGAIGHPLFRRFVVRLDYADKTVTLIRPHDFKVMDADTPVPFTFGGMLGTSPLVRGSVDGIPGHFTIDTGNGASLYLLTPFSKQHDLYSRYRTTPEVRLPGAPGGALSGHFARAGALMIGAVAVHHPVALLTTMKGGAFTNTNVAGNVGNKILKRFTVTFDEANQMMYLKPNKNYGKPMPFDRTGMRLRFKDGHFTVATVWKDGPAARAGLEAGDVIAAVNGKTAAQLGLAAYARMFRKVLHDVPGTQIKLTIGKGKNTRVATLVLQRLIPEKDGLKAPVSTTNSR